MPLVPLQSVSLSRSKKWVFKNRHPSVTDATNVTEKQSLYDSEYPSYYRDSDIANISSLPLELLREIFLFSLDLFVNPNHFWIDKNASPLNITHTCRLWRDFALKIPLLWTHVHIPHTIPPQLLELWIDRSQGLPLSMDVELSYDSRPRPRHEAAFLQILHSCVSRWEELYVQLGDPIEGFSFLTLPPSSFPSLRRVHWRVYGSHECFENFWKKAHLIPTIQEALFQQIPQECPWHQLTWLGLESVNGMEGVAVTIQALRQCSNLNVLHWTFWSSHDDMPIQIAPGPPVVIPKLLDFKVSLSEQEVAFLDYFTLPSIRRIYWGRGSSSEVFIALANLLHRSDARLEGLQMWLCGSHSTPLGRVDTEAVQILRQPCFDHLQVLYLGGDSPNGPFWEALKDPRFLPAIRSLRWPLRDPLADFSIVRSALKDSLTHRKLDNIGLVVSHGVEGDCPCSRVLTVAEKQLSDLVKLHVCGCQGRSNLSIIPAWFYPC